MRQLEVTVKDPDGFGNALKDIGIFSLNDFTPEQREYFEKYVTWQEVITVVFDFENFTPPRLIPRS